MKAEHGKPVTRQHQRSRLDIFANKIIDDEPHLARVRDISADGLFLVKLLGPEDDFGREVGLEIMLPQSDTVIWAMAKVVRHERSSKRPEGVGLKFTRIADHDRRQLNAFVQGRRRLAA